jgi:hypothetical protein
MNFISYVFSLLIRISLCFNVKTSQPYNSSGKCKTVYASSRDGLCTEFPFKMLRLSKIYKNLLNFKYDLFLFI